MKRFTRIYSGEFLKIFNKKTLINLAIGLIVLVALSIFVMEIVYQIDVTEVIQSVSESVDEEIVEDIPIEIPIELTGEALDAAIAEMKTQILNLEAKILADRKLPLKEKVRYSTKPGELYYMKATLAVMEYCKANDIPFEPSKTIEGFKSASSAISLSLGFFAIMAIIFSITAVSRLLADEWKRGTLKMTLIRPLKREELLGAKLLASFTAGIVVFFAGLIIISIYALARYGTATDSMYFVFNAKNVFVASSALNVVLQVLDTVIAIAAYVCFTMFIAVLVKNTVVSVVFPLISYFGITVSILGYAGVGAFLMSSNLNTLATYFTISSTRFHGMNFWWSFVALILYLSAFLATSFIVFDKRDIA